MQFEKLDLYVMLESKYLKDIITIALVNRQRLDGIFKYKEGLDKCTFLISC